MKIVFMGTPDFAVPVLERLIKEHEVICVYTRAPKSAGRGHELKKTPVHLVAEKYDIEVRTPTTLKDENIQKEFVSLDADVAVVAAYGLILPSAIIKAYRFGCLNVHASLLPRWRGAAPIQRAIEAGDKESGVTIMEVVEALDAGRMYKKAVIPITKETTGGTLHDSLSVCGAHLMSEVLQHITQIVPQEQDAMQVTYAQKLEKDEEKLDFQQSATDLERKIRAFNPFPATYFEYKNERFKVLKADVSDISGNPGEIIEGKKSLVIGCKKDSLEILEIQRQGKRIMTAQELLRGLEFEKGYCVN